jgi:hypothetical protein
MTHATTGKVATYLLRVLIALSMLANVLLGGQLGQTLSARNWELKRRGRPNIVCVIDLLLGKDHCVIAWTFWKTRIW